MTGSRQIRSEPRRDLAVFGDVEQIGLEGAEMGRGGPDRGKSGQNGLKELRWVMEDHGEAEMALKELRQIRSRYGEADRCRGGADRGRGEAEQIKAEERRSRSSKGGAD